MEPNFLDDQVLSFLVLTALRLFAAGVFLEFYLRQRDEKYLILIFAWLIYAASPIWGLIGYFQNGSDSHPLFWTLAALGATLLIGGVFRYYFPIPRGMFVVSFFTLFLILTLLNTISPRTGVTAGLVIQIGSLLVTFAVIVFRRKEFMHIGGNSYFWLFPIVLFGLMHALGFLLVYPNLPLSFRQFPTFLINLSLLIFFLHFEYTQALNKLRGTEDRYRFIFDGAPVGLWEFDTTEIALALKDIQSDDGTNIRQKLSNSPELFQSLMAKLRIRNVNQAVLDLFQVATAEDLIFDLIQGHSAEMSSLSAEIINAVVDGQRKISFETNLPTRQGERFTCILEVQLPKPGEPNRTTIISMHDITEQKSVENRWREEEARYRSLFVDSPIELWEEDFSEVKAYVDLLKFQFKRDLREIFELFPGEIEQCLTRVKIIGVNQKGLDANAASTMEEVAGFLSNSLEPEMRSAQADQLLAFDEGKFSSEGEITFHDLLGREKICLTLASVPKGYQADWGRVYISTLDITERRQAETALQTVNKELENRVQERTEKLQSMVDLMTGREVRMADLKRVVARLIEQVEEAGLEPVAVDPLLDRMRS
jgi:PAS domain-containing protein